MPAVLLPLSIWAATTIPLGKNGALEYILYDNDLFGVGTSSPWGKLSVEQGTTTPVFVVSDIGTSSPHLIVTGQGRVGVGTTSPGTVFGVNGSAVITEVLTVSSFNSTSTSATSTTQYGLNVAIAGGCLAINGTCVTTGGLSGTGSLNGFAYFDTLTTLAASSSPTVGWLTSTSSNPSIFVGGLLSQASSTFSSGINITCTNCITDANVVDTITASNYTPTSRALTIAGTANQITSSVGAQDLSADRTWTLSIPNHLIFPSSYQASLGTTTNATSTNITVTGNFIVEPLTSALVLTGAGGAFAEYTGTSCTNQFPRSLSALGAATCATIVDADVDNALTISAGTINNSPIGATTPHTGAFTTLSATGLTSLFGNLTATSTIDFSGGVFRGVASSSLTTTASGQSGVDTTSGKFMFRDGNTTQVISATSTFGFTVSSTTLGALGAYDDSSAGTTTLRRAGEWNAFSVSAVRCTATGTSTASRVAVRIGNGSASSSFMQADQDGEISILSSNNAFTLYEDMYIEVGSKVQAPDTVSCTMNKKVTAD